MSPAYLRPRGIAVGLALATLLLALPAALAQDPGGPGAAHRARVLFNNDTFELVSLTSLETVLAPSDTLPGDPGGLAGFWFELQSANGDLLYRRIVGDPVLLVFEGPAMDDGDSQPAGAQSPEDRAPRAGVREMASRSPKLASATRASLQRDQLEFRPVALEKGRAARVENMIADPRRDEAVPGTRTFTILMPAAADGDQLVLFGSPVVAGAQAEAAVELARFTLSPAPQGGER